MKEFFDDALKKEIKKCAYNGANIGLGIGGALGGAAGLALFGAGGLAGLIIGSIAGAGIGAAAGALYPIAKKLIIKLAKKLIALYHKHHPDAQGAAAIEAVELSKALDAIEAAKAAEIAEEHDALEIAAIADAIEAIEAFEGAKALDTEASAHSKPLIKHGLFKSKSAPSFFSHAKAGLSDDAHKKADDKSDEFDLSASLGKG